jgi:DNA polymerase-3 subunit alpha
MTAPAFVHLRVHSEFSVVDGITRIDPLVSAARKDGQVAVALTDAANLFGMLKFYKAARKAGVKPIIGVDMPVSNLRERDAPHRLQLLVRNPRGYLQLCELLTRAYLENQYRGRAELKREWLQPDALTGLIALSGGPAGEVGQTLTAGGDAGAAASHFARVFDGRYFIELQRIGTPESERYTQQAAQLAQTLGLPVVATHPVQFIDMEDWRAHEARVCISEGEILGNPRRVVRFSKEQFLKTQAQMAELFADIPSALANSVAIAQACNLTLELGKARLPQFPTPDGVSLDDYLMQLSREGLERRLAQNFADPAKRAAQRPAYDDRLDIECKMIVKMGFPGYFLIVQDFINWAKNNGVPVGPGRGSGAGSLVAYALGITDIDPLPYDLLFERFLNPERVSMPDFDIDFCQDNRDRVIDYVKQRYGAASVSQIATFGTLGAKAVVRDVGRVLDMPYKYCDSLSKLIPHDPTAPYTLEEMLAPRPEVSEDADDKEREERGKALERWLSAEDLRSRVETEEEAREIVDLSLPLEGLTRNVGMHAGGVLIAPGKLTDFCPLYCAEGSEDAAVSQFDKGDVEAVGLVKFDFLGLRNLTILELAVQYVRRFNPDRATFTLDDLAAFDDPATYKLLAQGNTTSVFQMESRGARDLCKKLKPTVFEDIIALNALNRPGPLNSGMVDDFIARKKQQSQTGRGDPVWYYDERLEPVLKSTYGVMVYQEQVMLVAQVLAGYSLGSADLLRRAMGKKDKKEMDRQREAFLAGATARGASQAMATDLFDKMAKFADYGFNKSHSAAYAVIGYHTAWLKCHYPAEYMAATLSSDMDSTDKVQVVHADTVAQAVNVMGPNINESDYRFVPVADGRRPSKTIRYGLGAVKGTGQAAVQALVAERTANGPYKDLFDFCRRIDKKTVNRRAIEALIRAGAFDVINDHRAQLLASLDTALSAAEAASASAAQNSLFGDEQEPAQVLPLANVPRFDERTQLAEEKLALGFYFSGHLFNAFSKDVRELIPRSLDEIEPSRDSQWFAGIVIACRAQFGKRGKMMFVTLDDGTAQIEVAVYDKALETGAAKLKVDELVLIQGKASHDVYSGGLRVIGADVYTIDELMAVRARELVLELPGPGSPTPVNGDKLLGLLAPHQADTGCRVALDVPRPSGRCRMELGQKWQIRVSRDLRKSLAGLGVRSRVVY